MTRQKPLCYQLTHLLEHIKVLDSGRQRQPRYTTLAAKILQFLLKMPTRMHMADIFLDSLLPSEGFDWACWMDTHPNVRPVLSCLGHLYFLTTMVRHGDTFFCHWFAASANFPDCCKHSKSNFLLVKSTKFSHRILSNNFWVCPFWKHLCLALISQYDARRVFQRNFLINPPVNLQKIACNAYDSYFRRSKQRNNVFHQPFLTISAGCALSKKIFFAWYVQDFILMYIHGFSKKFREKPTSQFAWSEMHAI